MADTTLDPTGDQNPTGMPAADPLLANTPSSGSGDQPPPAPDYVPMPSAANPNPAGSESMMDEPGSGNNVPGQWPRAYGMAEDARQEGYDWSDIDAHLAMARDVAASWGHHPAAVDDHLGYRDPQETSDQLANRWLGDMAMDPDIITKGGEPFSSNTMKISFNTDNMMGDYANALRDGFVQSPQQFLDLAGAAYGHAQATATDGAPLGDDTAANMQANINRAKEQLFGVMPDQKELVDSALAVHQASGDFLTDKSLDIIKDNLMNNWVQNREKPMDAYVRSLGDAVFAGQLNHELQPPPTILDRLASVYNSVSRIGAAGSEALQETTYRGFWDDLTAPSQPGSQSYLKGAETAMAWAGNNLGPVGGAVVATGVALAAAAAGSYDATGRLFAAVPIAGLSAGIQGISEISDALGNGPYAGVHMLSPQEATANAADVFNLVMVLATAGEGFRLQERELQLSGINRPEGTPASRPQPRSAGGQYGPWDDTRFQGPLPRGSQTVSQITQTLSRIMGDQSGELKPSIVNTAGLDTDGAGFRMEEPQRPVSRFDIKATGEPEPIVDSEGTPTGKFYAQEHMISDAQGNPVARAMISRDGDKAHIDSIRSMETGPAGFPGASNVLGPRTMRDMAKQYFSDNPDVNSVEGLRVSGARTAGEQGQLGAKVLTVTRDQVMGRPAEVLEQAGATPAEVVAHTAADAMGNTVENSRLADRITRLRALEIENGTEHDGNFFQRLLEKNGGSAETIELAKGYDAAQGLWDNFKHILGTDGGGGPNPFQVARNGWDALGAKLQYTLDRSDFVRTRDPMKAMIIERQGLSEHGMRSAMDTLDQLKQGTGIKKLQDVWNDKRSPLTGGDLSTDAYHQALAHAEGRASVPLTPDSPLFAVADMMKSLFAAARGQLAKGREFNDSETYKSLFRNPDKVEAAFGGPMRWSQIKRTPTFTEGIEKGLIPRNKDGFSSLVSLLQSQDHQIMRNNVLADARTINNGGLPAIRSSPRPIVGYTRLQGLGGNLYGADGLAKMWNNWTSRGVYGMAKVYQNTYQFLRAAGAVGTMFKLALPVYHAMAISNEAAMASLASGLGRVVHGDFALGLRDIGMGLVPPLAIAKLWKNGIDFQKNYMDKHFAGDPLAELFAHAGGHIGGRQAQYQLNAAPESFRNIGQHGDALFKMNGWTPGAGPGMIELGQRIKSIAGVEGQSAASAAITALPRLMGAGLDTAVKTWSSISGSNIVFDKMIPAVKQGAFATEMQAYLTSHPLATKEEQVAHARMIVNSMDNRFGELNQNNLLWNAATKQFLNATLLSFGWEYGSMRAFANAMQLAPGRGQLFAANPVAFRWAMAFGVNVGMQNALMQYFLTGQWPTSTSTPLADFMAGREGGKYPDGSPMRLVGPGYQKDAFNWYKDLILGGGYSARGVPQPVADLLGARDRAVGKANPFINLLIATMGAGYTKPWWNLPWQGHGDAGPIKKMMDNYYHFVVAPELLTPIFAEKMAQKVPGSHLPQLVRAAGINSAPRWFADPKGQAISDADFKKMMDGQGSRFLGSQNRLYGEQNQLGIGSQRGQ